MSTTPARPPTPDAIELSRALVTLLKGVLYRDENAAVWSLLQRYRAQVEDHAGVLGLHVVVDDAEGYAFLRQVDFDDADVPRLVPRHRLSFRVSLLLALLRKRLAEFDASSADPRLVMTREQVTDLIRVHLPDSTNEARVADSVDTLVTKAVDLGFLRRVPGQDGAVEVRRVLKAYVDAQWLSDLDTRLAEYLLAAEEDSADG